MRTLFALALALLLAGPAAGHSYRVGNVLVGHVWVAPTTEASSELYVPLLNKDQAADQLVAVIVPTAKLSELIDAASQRIGLVELPVNRPVALKPGGFRVRLIGLDRPLRVGDKLKLTLVFARAGSVAVEAIAEAGPSHR